jgi:CHAT domain-containing protein
MGKNSGSYSSLPKYLEWRIGNFFAAEKLLLESFERRKTNRRAVFGFTSGSLDLGRFYSDVGNFSNSEYHILESLKHLSKFSDTGSPIMVEHIYHLGLLYTRMGNYAKAERPFLDYWKQINGQIQKLFPYLSDGEKALNFDKYRTSLEELKAYSLLRYKTKPEITSHLYNQQLATKSLLLNSSAKWKHRIKTSGDKKLFLLFTEWEASQITLGKLLISTDSTTRAGIDSVQKKTDKMERELSQRSENFARLTDNRQTDWKDIQATLKPGDAAIEIIRIQKYGIARTVTDSSDPKKTIYRIKGLTDTVHYAALIVKPGLKFPEMVSLANGNEMEGKDILYYKNCIQNKISDEYSYKTFWKKIGDKLGPKIKRVYFSPDGIYHSINMSTLFNPQTHKFLLEEKEIRLLTVTKDLILPRKEEEMNRLASLVGHPNFNGNTFQGLNKQDQERKSPTSSYFLTLSRGETVSELPGTKTEVENISDFLQKKGWEVQTLMGDNALEENIKEAYKPRILHLATHGFFQPDTTMGNNPLFHSGLLLSGANKTFAGEKSDEAEDGILTAYEAMNLNLDNTDLVVLSACETGLGEIKNGEGVYGLQRAFKVAGAKSIIMSLWKVSDQATQELMVSFYKHWLNSPLNPPKGDLKTPNRKISGNTETESPLRGLGAGTKRASFLKAQKELKTKYPEPFYWGAFVMVGE